MVSGGSCEAAGIKLHGLRQDVPAGGPEGTCWCGVGDHYCLCTPNLSVDVIIEVRALAALPSSAAPLNSCTAVRLALIPHPGCILVAFVLQVCQGSVPHIVLVKRNKPPQGWATPGGYILLGETAESAVERELEEETGGSFTHYTSS